MGDTFRNRTKSIGRAAAHNECCCCCCRMEPNKLMGVSTTSGVRVFTVFVLSGSLFLLIYNIGRRRINIRNSNPYYCRDKDATTASTSAKITNPNYYSRGYFDHYKEKPFTDNRRSSLTIALDGAGVDHGGVRDETSTRNSGSIFDTHPSGTSKCGIEHKDEAFNYGTENEHQNKFSNAFPESIDNEMAAAASDRFPCHSPRLGHERYMIDDMRDNGYFNNPRRRSSFAEPALVGQGAGSSILGDMSQLESRSTKNGVVKPRPHVPPLPFHQSTNTSAPPEGEEDEGDGQQSFGKRPMLTPVATVSLKEMVLKPALYIFIWCILSYSSDVYSTTGFGAKMTQFPAPFLKITVQFLVQFVISICMLRWPRNKVLVMSWSKYMFIGISGAFVLPVATAVVFDQEHREPSILLIALTVPILSKPKGILGQAYMILSSIKNTSFEADWDAKVKSKGYIPLMFFLFALAFRLEDRSLSMVFSISIIAVGFTLSVSEGKRLGLIESSAGPLLSGFRTAATQTLLQKREFGMITPVVTMRALSPSVAVVAALCSFASEPWATLRNTEFFDTPEHFWKFSGHIVVGTLLATALALAELVVIYHTSALTVIILGMLKDVCLLVPRFSRGHLSSQNAFGLAVFTTGLICLLWLKYQRSIHSTRQHNTSSYEEDAQELLILSSLADPWSWGWQFPRISWPKWRPRAWSLSWPPVATYTDALLVSYVSPRARLVRGFFLQTWEGGVRISRKLRALRELAS